MMPRMREVAMEMTVLQRTQQKFPFPRKERKSIS
jgi:hypothetical protein